MIAATRATGGYGDFPKEVLKRDLSVEDRRVRVPIQENLIPFNLYTLHRSRSRPEPRLA